MTAGGVSGGGGAGGGPGSDCHIPRSVSLTGRGADRQGDRGCIRDTDRTGRVLRGQEGQVERTERQRQGE